MTIKTKIKTNNKSYPLKDSPFFKLYSENRLCDLLNINKENLEILLKKPKNYYRFFSTNIEKTREIQSPQGLMYKVHNRIASLLTRIETNNYLFSGKKGLSYIDNAKQHQGENNTLTTDIKSFFPNTSKLMIFNFYYYTMKCSKKIANLLANLCTIDEHLPTGSQLSMPLAYWASYQMFEELNKISTSRNIVMTLYVDDLTFSGRNVNNNFKCAIKNIIERYGHSINTKKTKLYKQSQPKFITGLKITQTCDIPNIKHKKLHQLLNEYKYLRKNPINKKLQKNKGKQLIGYISSILEIKPKCTLLIHVIKEEIK